MTYNLWPFLLITIFILNFVWFVLCNSFFVKLSNNFFTFKITNKICTGHSIFNVFNHKNFFGPIWNVNFCKNGFIFWYSYMIANLKLRIFIVIFIVLDFTSKDFILIVLSYALLYLLTISGNSSIYTFVNIEVICL